ncbi:MAG TPA: hypothetical protein PLC81_12495, partial [Bacteroidales bacterium]|nr:hypothetical protein [Bacteroidales bacterium]
RVFMLPASRRAIHSGMFWIELLPVPWPDEEVLMLLISFSNILTFFSSSLIRSSVVFFSSARCTLSCIRSS